MSLPTVIVGDGSLPALGAQWRPKAGDRVVLVATSQPGKFEPADLHGRHGTLLDLTRPHGYARVQFDGRPSPELVHPESLQPEPPAPAPVPEPTP